MSITADRSPRFRGGADNPRGLDATSAVVIAGIAGVAIGGIVAPATALMFFAIGAGAGYSLSGSV